MSFGGFAQPPAMGCAQPPTMRCAQPPAMMSMQNMSLGGFGAPKNAPNEYEFMMP